MTPIRYILAAPRFLGWLFPLLMVACRFADDLRLADDAVLRATWRPWMATHYGYTLTLAAGQCWHPASVGDARTAEHEHVHVRQDEDNAIAGLFLALVATLVTFNAWWLLLWPVTMLVKTAGFLGAILRYGDVYRDAEHERSAYAQTDALPGSSQSWLDVQRSRS